MKTLQGIAVSKGIAIGSLSLRARKEHQIAKTIIMDVDSEIDRVTLAKNKAVESIEAIYQEALKRLNEEDSSIFKIQVMMLEDIDWIDSIQSIITGEKVCAEYAVWRTAMHFHELFEQMEDDYMRARGADILDISRRLLRCLNPELSDSSVDYDRESILGLPYLMPSEVMQMNKRKVLGLITEQGSKTSHSAILARTLGIPAVVGLVSGYAQLADNIPVIVDGFTGEIIVEPDEHTIKEYRKKQTDYFAHLQRLKELRGLPAITQDGVSIRITANINRPEEVEQVLENDAEGIGLFRSESLFLRNSRYPPDEEKQYLIYKNVLEQMGGRRVVVRTFDLSADKQALCMPMEKEENPAMGFRSIRIALKEKELFLAQLRALLRASIYGKLAIMFPMITSMQELYEAKALVQRAKEDLIATDSPFDDSVEIGAMIETPAAVMIAELLAKEVNFFSIGTNDLTQYTLAADRQNPIVSGIYNPRHPAVLRMIKMTVQNAKRNGIWTSICGESAADTALLQFYLGIGVDELSVAPASVLELRRDVRQKNLKETIPGQTKLW